MCWRQSNGQSGVKLLYDGQCPFCRREVDWLKRHDRDGRLATEDIADPAFRAEKYGLTQEAVMGVLHGVMPDGRIVLPWTPSGKPIVRWGSAGSWPYSPGR